MPSEPREQPFTLFAYERAKNKHIRNEIHNLRHMWNYCMTEKEKQPYIDKAARLRGDKRTSSGISIAEINREIEEKLQEEQRAKDLVCDLVEKLHERKELLTYSYSVVCITHYVEDDQVFYPAEIGACSFSFTKGLIRTFNHILPVKLPSGSRHNARMHSESTHQIPLENKTENLEDTEGFKYEFDEFLISQKMGSSVNLFTRKNLVDQTKSMIENLDYEFEFGVGIEVLSLDCLFDEIFSHLKGEKNDIVRSEELSNSRHELNNQIACTWHQLLNTGGYAHCSLSFVQRWIFNMFESINLKKLGIELIEGKHFLMVNPFSIPNMKTLSLSEKRKKGKTSKSRIASQRHNSFVASPRPATSPLQSSAMASPLQSSSMTSPLHSASMASQLQSSFMASPLQSSSMASPLQSASMTSQLQSSSMASPLQSASMASPLQSASMASPLQSASMTSPLQSASMASPLQSSAMTSPRNSFAASASLPSASEAAMGQRWFDSSYGQIFNSNSFEEFPALGGTRDRKNIKK